MFSSIYSAFSRVGTAICNVGVIKTFCNGNRNICKKKIVFVGGGWGFISMSSKLDLSSCEVSVIEQNDLYNFTPLITQIVSNRIPKEVCEIPFSELTDKGKRGKIRFIKGKAVGVDKDRKEVIYLDLKNEGESVEKRVSYDYLVFNIGSDNCDYVPGVKENALFIRTVSDALKLREIIIGNIKDVTKRYNSMNKEEKTTKLTFVVSGGGPTGVELSGAFSEIVHDFTSRKEFRHLIPLISIIVLQKEGRLIPCMDEKASEYVKNILETKAKVKVMLETELVSVSKTEIIVRRRNKEEIIPCGLLVWASGTSPRPLTMKICESIQEQKEKIISGKGEAILVNERLQVYGIPNSFSLGDCTLIVPTKLSDKFEEIYTRALESLRKPSISFLKEDKTLNDDFPQLLNIYEIQDIDKNKVLSKEEFKSLLERLDVMYQSPPPASQTASQQGKYLSNVLNNSSLEDSNKKFPVFKYKWFGMLSYIFNDYIIIYNPKLTISGGYHTLLFWRFLYALLVPSLNSKLILASTWTTKLLSPFIFGRDETIYSIN
ncbi:mitochondrial NADH dehydrogenase [Cryptosporidium ryanae]|uniref:mitochondrial NADH dehydrogenase n=1 Tax=Cryptosporidium ryanae TaxID=515981 RepID=UPI00351A9646|nr:mitochondrial NADH dehydrogenase [Cryptosporidium ryanae]